MELEKEFNFYKNDSSNELDRLYNKFKITCTLTLLVGIGISCFTYPKIFQYNQKSNQEKIQKENLMNAQSAMNANIVISKKQEMLNSTESVMEILNSSNKNTVKELENRKKLMNLVFKNEHELSTKIKSNFYIYDKLIVKEMKFTSLAYGNYFELNNKLRNYYLDFQKEMVTRETNFNEIIKKYKKDNNSLTKEDIDFLNDVLDHLKLGKLYRSTEIDAILEETTSPKNFEITKDAEKIKAEVIAEITRILTPELTKDTSRKVLKE